MSIAWQDLTLGIGDANLILESESDLEQMLLALFKLAQRRVLLRAPRLDWPIYQSEELDGEISRIITTELNNRVLILLEDEEHFLHHNTRLLAQCRKFSTYIKVRTLPKEYCEPTEMYMVVDDIAFLHQARSDISYGVANLNAAGRARTLTRQFIEAWERSEPPAELFRLGLS